MNRRLPCLGVVSAALLALAAGGARAAAEPAVRNAAATVDEGACPALPADAFPEAEAAATNRAGPDAAAPALAPGSVKVGGAVFRPGMSHAEALAQIRSSKGVGWFSVELDAAPYDELLKFDSWTLAYNLAEGAAPRSGTLALSFENGKLRKVIVR